MQMILNEKFVSINLEGKRWRNEGGFNVSVANQPRAVAYAIADNKMAAFMSRYAAGTHVADYLKNI